MADVFTKEKRSAVMALVRGKENRSTELRLVAVLRAEGLTGWRRHLPLPGRPDFAFTKERLAVFVDGCFWHGCPVHYTAPVKSRDFWRAKVEANRARDRRSNSSLRKLGWKVIRLWEHELKSPPATRRALTKLRRALGQRASSSSAPATA